jgi:hypothetical protein
MRATTFLTIGQLMTWCKITPSVDKLVTSLAQTGGLATAVSAAHGFRNGDTVTVTGADQSGYNISAVISVLDANTFTFAVAGGTASPATGTIMARSAQDAIVTIMADAICEGLEKDTGRVFAQRTVIENRNGDNRNQIYLRKFPVISITSFSIDTLAVSAADYSLEKEDGCIRMKNGRIVSSGVGNVDITYSAGYITAEIPADAIMVALDICKVCYDKLINGTISMSSLTAGANSVVAIEGLPKQTRDAIRMLRSARMIG